MKRTLSLFLLFFVNTVLFSKSFSHSGTFYRIPTNENLEISGDVTVEAWLRPNAAQSNIGNVLIKGAYVYAFGIRSDETIAWRQNGGPESVTWSLTGLDASSLSIDAGGNLSFNSPVDFENPLDDGVDNIYNLEIIATDQLENVGSIPITVTVTNENENPPILNSPEVPFTISELATDQTVVGALTWSDADDESLLDTYSFYALDEVPFIINGSGQILVNGIDVLDYETQTQYTFNVEVEDAFAQLSNVVSVTIDLINENDNSPILNSPEVPFTISELATDQTVVGALTWSDVDDESLIDTYSFYALDEVPFIINGSGQILVNGIDVLDYETQTQYTFNVEVEDAFAQLSNVVSVTIDLINENDNSPILNSPEVPFAISELATDQTVVGALTWSDVDDESLLDTYSFYALDEVPFIINGSGQILVNGIDVLDYETQTQYTFNVEVEDAFAQLSNVVSVTIDLINENDNSPILNSPEVPFTISELATDQTVVGVLTWSDVDDESLIDTYSFYALDEVPFIINGSGQILVNGIDVLDYETQTQYTFNVEVEDALAQLSNVVSVTIDLINENDNSPILNSPEVPFAISELATDQTVVGALTWIDVDDESLLDTYSFYALDEVPFIINGSGQILVNGIDVLDYETQTQYTFNVEVEDAFAQLSNVVSVSIDLINENDNSPILNSPEVPFAISELATDQTVVGALTWSDVDDESLIDTYTFNVLDEVPFIINGSGQILVNGVDVLDYETQTQYTFNVEVEDALAQGSNVVSVTVDIDNENDNVPVLNTPEVPFAISELATDQTVVGALTWSDADDESLIDTYTFNVLDEVPFIINGSGQVLVNGVDVLDYETQTQYTFNVEVEDALAQGSNVVSVTVDIDNENDNVPVLNTPEVPFAISELATDQTVVGALTWSDADDESLIDTYTFNVLDEVPFIINGSGQILVNGVDVLDYETQTQYTFNVEVEDALAQGSNVVSVTVDIDNENDNAPVLNTPEVPFAISELATDQTVVGALTWSDADDESLLDTYTFNVLDEVPFIINGSGQVLVNGVDVLDYETQTQYTFNVEVEDALAQGSNVVSVTVDIDNENDNAPVLNTPEVPFAISELATDQTVVGALTWSDADDESLIDTYTFNVLDEVPFIINGSGQVLVNGVDVLDYETQTQYTFNVEVEDALAQGSNVVSVTVDIDNENDNVPVLNTPEVPFAISELATDQTVVGALTWSDADDESLIDTYTFNVLDEVPFIINGSGQVLVNGVDVLDYETQTQYTFNVEVEDALAQGSNVVSVTVDIDNENDNAPVLNTPEVPFAISELATDQTVVGALTWSDADDESLIDTYTFNVLDEVPFIINGSGQILVNGVDVLDYETQTQYTFNVEVEDALAQLSNVVSVTIDLINENDNSPILNSPEVPFTISELATDQTVVGALTWSDVDDESLLDTYSFYALDEVPFIINGSGQILVNGIDVLDYETQTQYTFNVEVEDALAQLSNVVSVTIDLINENDNSPILNSPEVPFAISELATDQTVVGALTWSDVDDESLIDTYSFYALDEVPFIINGSGQILVNGIDVLDYETQTQYTFNVEVEDAFAQLSNVVSVTIDLINENDNPPILNSPEVPFTISELATDQTVVGALTWSDVDDESLLDTYSFYALDEVPFIINGSGQILVNGIDVLDYETQTQYTFNVEVEDAFAQLSNVVSVTIDLINENDNPPILNSPEVPFTISELATDQTVVGALTWSDVDDESLLDTYSFYALDEVPFIINGSGQILVNGIDVLDYETQTQYTFNVEVEDAFAQLSNVVSVTIDLINENDNSPILNSPEVPFTISELATDQTVVGALTWSDVDDESLLDTYSFYALDEVPFIINGSGQILVNGIDVLDYETQTQYTFNVEVEDALAQLSNVVSVTIDLINENDNSPILNSPEVPFTISELATDQTVVGALTWIDVDDESLIDTYSFYALDEVPFIINGSGQILVNGIDVLDYETQTQYTFNVEVEDAFAQLSNVVSVTIDLINENDNSPILNSPEVPFTISELATDQTVVGALTWIDVDDESLIDTYSFYALDEVPFIINGSGQILVNGIDVLDYEKQTQYTFNVEVEDAFAQLSNVVSVTIDLINENDNSPVLNTPEVPFAISELATDQTVVGALTWSDADDESLLDTYSFYALDEVPFIINGSGQILINGIDVLDYETQTQYTFNVEVEDAFAQLSNVVSVTIDLINENDNSPILNSPEVPFTISELATDQTVVGALTWSDVDDESLIDTYSFYALDEVPFIINGSGQVLVNGVDVLDYETQTQYTFNVEVEDALAQVSNVVSVTIDLINENDLAPFFLSANTVNFTENDEVIVLDIDADDSEGGAVDAGIVYNIVGGADAELFTIGESGFLSFNASPDFDVAGDANADNVYEIDVEANDGLATVESIQITVTDINDESPVIAVSQFFNISEAAINGEIIGTVSASDIDGISLQNWVTGSGNVDGIFAINATSGELTIGDNTNLDFETTIQYVLTLTVEDDAANISLSETITIDINNENDESPIIAANQVFSLSEDALINDFLGTVSASDVDGTSLQNWTITTGNEDGIFTIDGFTGGLTVLDNANLDYELNFQYTLMLTVEDEALNISLNETIIINILDVNDAPVITGQVELSTLEETILTIALSDLTVEDVDNNTYPEGFTLTVQPGLNYTFEGNTIIPATDFNGALTVPVIVNDGTDNSDQFDLTVFVEAVNDIAVITGQVELSTLEETILTIALSDLTVEDVDNNTYPEGFTLTVQTGLNYTFEGNTIIPATDFNGVLTVPVIVNDGTDNSDQFDLIVEVTPVNDTPEIVALDPIEILETTVLGTEIVTMTATDVDANTTFTWSIVSGNIDVDNDSILPFIIDESTGVITVNDTEDIDFERGTTSFSLEVLVSDGLNTASTIVEISITDVVEDTISPTVILSTTATGSTNAVSIPLMIVFSEAVTGFTIESLTLTNASASNFAGTGSNYTVDISPTADGEFTAGVLVNVAIDLAGNGSEASNVLTLLSDRTNPAPLFTSLLSPATNLDLIPIVITFNEAVTGLEQADLTVTNGTINSLTGSGATYSLSVSPVNEGDVIVVLAADAAIDAAGNTSTAESFSIASDKTGPLVTITSAGESKKDSPLVTGTIGDENATIILTIDGNTYEAENNGEAGWQVLEGRINSLAVDTYAMSVIATDVAGNETTAGGTLTIIGGPPTISAATAVTFTSFTANWQARTGVVSYEFDLSRNAAFTKEEVDYTSFETTANTLIIPNRKFSTSYYYRVRAVYVSGFVSENSATMPVTTLTDEATSLDEAALLLIYDALGGVDWTRNQNWRVGLSIQDWDGIDFSGGTRVKSVDLSSSGLVGVFPEILEGLEELETLTLNNNKLTDIPALSSLSSLTTLDVSNNKLEFGSLENNLSVTNYTIAPQQKVLDEADELFEILNTYQLSREVSGSNNTYEWFKRSLVDANDVTQLSSTGTTHEVVVNDFTPEGEYFVEVTSGVAGLAGVVTLTSNSIIVKVSSLGRDIQALIGIYNSTDGSNWIDVADWNTMTSANLINFAPQVGLSAAADRVTSINLQGRGLKGDIPKSINDIAGLTSVNLSENQITGIPNMTRLVSLTSLDVSNNYLDFGDLEPNMDFSFIAYSSQARISDVQADTVRRGTDYLIDFVTGGTQNQYSWTLTNDVVKGADLLDASGAAVTSKRYLIADINYENMGAYNVTVANSLVPDLILESDPIGIYASAEMAFTILGTVGNDIDQPLQTGVTQPLRIIAPDFPFDSVAAQTIAAGKVFYEDLVLGDYLIGFTGQRQNFLPTYYKGAFLWEEADTLLLRDDFSDTVYMQRKPVPLRPGDGEGKIFGGVEADLPNEPGGRIQERRKVKKAGCSVRRFRASGRGSSQEGTFELVAYVETNDNGEFTFDYLPEGTYRFNIEYPGIPMDPDSFIEIEIGGDGFDANNFKLDVFVAEGGIGVERVSALAVYSQYFWGLDVYPIPASDFITIRYDRLLADEVEVKMVDMRGETVITQPIRRGWDESYQLDVSQLAEGTYLLHFMDPIKGSVVAYKIFVRH